MHDFSCNDTGFMFFAFLSVGILNNGAAIFEKNVNHYTATTLGTRSLVSLGRRKYFASIVSMAETAQEKPR